MTRPMQAYKPFTKGTLWSRLCEVTERALASGHLVSIDTRFSVIEHEGMPFVVRVANNLQRKANDKQQHRTAPAFNPFLPPEAQLTVADVSDTHIAILNKFNVVEHHLLIITRNFEEQEALLTQSDFEALWRCMDEYEGLGFYNGGEIAGASQRHKHLQLIPLPLAGSKLPLPVDALIEAGNAGPSICRLATLPFAHRFFSFADSPPHTTTAGAALSHACYLEMLKETGIDTVVRGDGQFQSAPYNLLVTRRWMMLVPRSAEFCNGISINAMGFAGSLFVRSEQELESVQQTGPMNLLRAVS